MRIYFLLLQIFFMVVGWLSIIVGVFYHRSYNKYSFYVNLFKNIIILTILFFINGKKINVVDMMNAYYVFDFISLLRSRKAKAWEYKPNDRILIINLHKLFVLISYDDKKQISNILALFTLRWLTMLLSMRMWSLTHEMVIISYLP
jgi:energy-coupling factor transporter transmembrane protein EcfT